MHFPPRLPIPDEVLEIARALDGAGFAVWCIGGAVRDNLLDQENKDFDLATSATPDAVQRLFKRTVPVGIEHGTVAVLDRHNTPHEVTTFRKDVETDGRHAQVAFGVSLDDDLARRDFTINAIAYHPLTHEWKDPFSGASDLEAKVLRAVGDPGTRFREDYLRILRLLRFAARFGFAIERSTWEAARANAAGLDRLSAERVRAEWFNGLKSALVPSELLQLWSEVGAVGRWLGEMENGETGKGKGETGNEEIGKQEAGSEKGTGGDAIDRLPRDPVLMTSFLSADPVATLTRLKCSRAEVERAARIAEHRDSRPDASSEVAVRKWLAKVGAAADDLLAIADAEGRGEALIEAVASVRRSRAPLTLGDLAVTGQDLLGLGVPQGPKIGEMLRLLMDAVLERPELNTTVQLLERARSVLDRS